MPLVAKGGHYCDVFLLSPDPSIGVPAPPPRLLLPGEVSRFGEQPLSEWRCFLCGRHLSKTTATREHVFPKWLQRRHNMGESGVVLLNDSRMKYRQLTVPCCLACNGGALSALERRVRDGFTAGADAVAELDPYDVFLWLAKLSYGLLYRELLLPNHRSAPRVGTIVGREHLETYRIQHALLQGTFRRVLPHAFPATITLFKTQVHEKPGLNFDYRDNYFGPFVALRSNDVGIVAILQDWGLSRGMGWPQFDRAEAAQPLTTMQFNEVVASGMYYATLLNRPVGVRHWEEGGATHLHPHLPDPPVARTELFEPFDMAEYARLLAGVLHLQPERVLRDDMVLTTLTTPNGTPVFTPFRTRLSSVAAAKAAAPEADQGRVEGGAE